MSDRSSIRLLNLRNLIAGLSVIVVLMAFLPAQTAQAQSLIVRSTGPSAGQYRVGRKLADNAVVTLRRGDRITILNDAGTRILTGPARIRVDRATPEKRRSIRDLVAYLRDTKRERAGATRRVLTAADGTVIYPENRPSTLWFADADKGGTVCLADEAQLTLFRGRAGEERRMWLEPLKGGEAHLVYVPKAANEVVWPRNRPPLASLWKYRSNDAGAASAVEFFFTRIAVDDDDPLNLAQALLDAGCDNQLNYVAVSLSTADAVEGEALLAPVPSPSAVD